LILYLSISGDLSTVSSYMVLWWW